MARNQNSLAEGIDAGSRLASVINNDIDTQDREQDGKEALAKQLQAEQDARTQNLAAQQDQQAKTIAAQSALEQQRLTGEGQIHADDRTAAAQNEKQRLADELELQNALAQNQADKASHALADQHQSYFDNMDKLQANLKLATAGGNPDAIASAQQRLASWQQMGPGIFDTAKKNQGINYTIDPQTGDMKVTGTVTSPDDLAKVKAAITGGQDTAASNPVVSQLDKAIADRQKQIGQVIAENPTNASTVGDYVPFIEGDQEKKSRLEKELVALQGQRTALAPQSAAGGTIPAQVPAAPVPVLGMPEPAPAPAPTQLGMPPPDTTQLGGSDGPVIGQQVTAPAPAVASAAAGDLPVVSRTKMGDRGKSLQPGQVIYQGGKPFVVGN